MNARLSAEERTAWIRLALVSSSLPAALDAQLTRDSNISHIDYLVLTLLAQADGRSLPMSRLAALSGSSPSRLSHVVTGLEKDGYVTRARAETDARVIHATLTEAGRDVARGAAPGHIRNIRALVFDRLSTEQVAELSDLMATILGALDPGGELARAATEPSTN